MKFKMKNINIVTLSAVVIAVLVSFRVSSNAKTCSSCSKK